MATWVLIVWSLTTHCLATVPGYASEQECRQAGEAWKGNSWAFRGWECIPGPTVRQGR